MSPRTRPAFGRLRSTLIRARWRRLDARFRIHVGIVIALLAVFAFWQLRLRYAELALFHGRTMASGVLLGTLVTIAVLGGVATAVGLRSRLRRAPRGPEWFALPATLEQLVAQQAWEAELPWRFLWALALADWIAAIPATHVIALAGALVLFPALWVACIAIARRSGSADATGLASIAETWAVRTAPRGRDGRRSGTWKRQSPVLALLAKDLQLARHARRTRPALMFAALLTALSVAAWRAPSSGLQPTAFVLALLALASCGEWLIAIGARDPFAVLRVLPVSVRAVWCARALLGAAATVVIVAAQALAAGAAPAALQVSIVWLVLAGLAIAALAINLQLTLFPAHGPALRVFGLALALVFVCTFVVPVAGWIVMLAAVAQTARKLPRWWGLEDLG